MSVGLYSVTYGAISCHLDAFTSWLGFFLHTIKPLQDASYRIKLKGVDERVGAYIEAYRNCDHVVQDKDIHAIDIVHLLTFSGQHPYNI